MRTAFPEGWASAHTDGPKIKIAAYLDPERESPDGVLRNARPIIIAFRQHAILCMERKNRSTLSLFARAQWQCAHTHTHTRIAVALGSRAENVRTDFETKTRCPVQPRTITIHHIGLCVSWGGIRNTFIAPRFFENHVSANVPVNPQRSTNQLNPAPVNRMILTHICCMRAPKRIYVSVTFGAERAPRLR